MKTLRETCQFSCGLVNSFRTVRAVVAVLVVSACQLNAQTVPSNGLIGYWTGDNTTHDSQLNISANDGTWSGTANYVTGSVGDAFNFVNGSSYVSIADRTAYDFSSSDFSVGFRFNLNSTTGSKFFLAQDNGPANQPKWAVDYNSTASKFEFQYYGPSINNNVLSSSVTPLSADTWYQLTATKSGTTYSLYLDSTSIGSQTFTDAFPNPTNPLTLGFAEGSLNFSGGSLDEVVLYNRALSGSEISGLATPEPSTSALMVLAAGLVCARARRRGRHAHA